MVLTRLQSGIRQGAFNNVSIFLVSGPVSETEGVRSDSQGGGVYKMNPGGAGLK